MKVTLLGTGGPRPDPRRQGPATLVQVGEENLPSTSTGGSGQGLIDINTASAEELENLPNIGPTLAQSIIDHRTAHGPFATIEGIMEVRGIGEGLFEEIRELIVVR